MEQEIKVGQHWIDSEYRVVVVKLVYDGIVDTASLLDDCLHIDFEKDDFLKKFKLLHKSTDESLSSSIRRHIITNERDAVIADLVPEIDFKTNDIYFLHDHSKIYQSVSEYPYGKRFCLSWCIEEYYKEGAQFFNTIREAQEWAVSHYRNYIKSLLGKAGKE